MAQENDGEIRPNRGFSVMAYWPLANVCFVYLAITVVYSLWVPAWEANDELDHVANIEHILEHGELIPLRTFNWHETHQPPLYYLATAAWQRIIGIPAFEVVSPAGLVGPGAVKPHLFYTHVYSPEEREAAVALHKLRLLSVLFGLGTVVLTYAIAVLSLGRRDVALSVAAFVGFLPKFNVISSVVTNDSLVVMLCALGLFLALVVYKVPISNPIYRCAILLGLGATAGAALITKLNSIPLICLLFVFVVFVCPGQMLARATRLGWLLIGAVLTSGWWIYLNYSREGSFLGQNEAQTWLSEVVPGLISVVPWTDSNRFLNFVPFQLFQSSWYIGGWNQFALPFAMNLALALLAGIAWFMMAKGYFDGGLLVEKFDRKMLLHAGCCLMGLAAVVIIARSTTQAEGRVAYVALPSFALIASVGLVEGLGAIKRLKVGLIIWPALFLVLNVYVLARFVMPFRNL